MLPTANMSPVELRAAMRTMLNADMAKLQAMLADPAFTGVYVLRAHPQLYLCCCGTLAAPMHLTDVSVTTFADLAAATQKAAYYSKDGKHPTPVSFADAVAEETASALALLENMGTD